MESKKKPHSGVIVPMITPFTEDGDLDEPAVRKVTEYLASNGVSVFLLGTTGEAASIPSGMKDRLVELAAESLQGNTRLYAGISDTCLETSVQAARRYADCGVDAVVAHLPYYYPMRPDDMLHYYRTLADNIPLPLILYNIPATTHLSIPLDVVGKLSEHPRIAGIKDSERDAGRLREAIDRWKDHQDFSVLIGWTAFSAEGLLQGADGLVPSTGNIAPGLFRQLYEAARRHAVDAAETFQRQTDVVAEVYQKDRNLSQSLAALKCIMEYLGLCQPYTLPPIRALDDARREDVRDQIEALNLNNILEME